MASAVTEIVRVVVCHGGKVLAVDHRGRGPRLGIPGGHIEPGESPDHAAARELQEETGLTVVQLAPIGMVSEPGRHTYLYVAEATGRLRPSDEGRPLWASPNQLRAGRYGPFHVAALRRARVR